MEKISEKIKTLKNIETTINLQDLNENEYYDKECDTIRCKKCGESLLTDFEVFGKRQRCICSCKEKEIQEEEERAIKREKLSQIEELKKASLLGKKYKDVSFGSTKQTSNSFNIAFKRCKDYCKIPEQILEKGYGIYLYGNSGTGKTHLTACMCNELVSKGYSCLFTNFFEISKSIRSTFGSRYESEASMINKIVEVDFLFIDDFGTEIVKKNGEDTWLQEKIFEIINKRYNENKPIIFSSNYKLNELIDDRGILGKTVDRILEVSAVIKIVGDSQRKIKGTYPF